MAPKVVSTIEARMSSTRFPGKVLQALQGRTVLEWTISRLKMTEMIDEFIVATTGSISDDPIADLCEHKRFPYYRGSEDDVLDRVARAARILNPDIIVQAGADCPFYDPDIIDQMIAITVNGHYDYVCNDFKEGYPVGVNIHVLSAESLYGLEKLATLQKDRENVVTYIWDHVDDYRIYNLIPPPELRRPDIRLTVDYPEDLILLNELAKGMGNDSFRTMDIVRYLEKNDHLLELNKMCKMKKQSCAYRVD